MPIAIIVLSLIIIILTVMILYLSAFNKLSEINYKITESENNIKNSLNQKYELMQKLEESIKKVCRKKDYLKDFNEIAKHNYNNHDLDNALDESLKTMIQIQEDHKSLKTDEFNNTLKDIKKIDQNIIANKKFFNKNNNALIKNLKGYYKIVAKYTNITIKNSYEIKKEPKED